MEFPLNFTLFGMTSILIYAFLAFIALKFDEKRKIKQWEDFYSGKTNKKPFYEGTKFIQK